MGQGRPQGRHRNGRRIGVIGATWAARLARERAKVMVIDLVDKI
jgi:hypothetical protein